MESKSSDSPKRIAPNTYHVARSGGVLVTFASALDANATVDTGKLTKVSVSNMSVDVMAWGAKNDLPQYREEMIVGNNIVPALIERKKSIITGQGWFAYKVRYEDTPDGPMKRIMDEVPMPDEAKDFFKKWPKTARKIVAELLKHSLAMPEFIRSRDNKVFEVRCLETKHMRAAKKQGKGEIKTWYWSNAWTKSQQNIVSPSERVIEAVPVYDEAQKQPKFVLPLLEDTFNDGYYPIPAYWGGRYWIELSNIIPLFHRANLRHGQLPRWNIIIPHDYFFDYEKMNQAITEEERARLVKEFQAKEQAFVDDLNQVLTGLENTGRTIVTKSELIEAIGGRYEKRIQIEPLDGKLNDQALLPLYEASNVANISAQAIHPSLANIETQGKLSSGTEIRNAYLLYLIIAAPTYRDMLQEVIEVVKFENGWPEDVHYAIRDAELTTLAENPAGVRPAKTNVGV